MADPSSSVSPQLLHHLHALCIMKYPQHQAIQPELLVELLLKTPQIAQQHPFSWMMIDPPSPGTLMLSWNPPQMVGVCASDGYVWADAEVAHTVPVKGHVRLPPPPSLLLSLAPFEVALSIASLYIYSTYYLGIHTHNVMNASLV